MIDAYQVVKFRSLFFTRSLFQSPSLSNNTYAQADYSTTTKHERVEILQLGIKITPTPSILKKTTLTNK